CANQSGYKTGAGCPDGVAQCGGAAVSVDLVMRPVEFLHGGHGDHSEGFVDFKKVHLLGRPAYLGEQLLHGTDRSGGEPFWFVRMLRVANNARQRGGTQFLGGGFAHERSEEHTSELQSRENLVCRLL